MTVIHYKEINRYLKKTGAEKDRIGTPVYLFFGEEVLYKSALEMLLDTLLPARDRKFNYETFDGAGENVLEAVARLNTYSLGGGMKVVALLDSNIFSLSQKELEIPSQAQDMSEVLVDALAHGFPKKHHLIITAETVDKRRRLFKLISDIGLVVDCSVPKGERRADKAVQDSVLSMKTEEILGKRGKKISSSAYAALHDMTGFDLRTFENNLIKLADFIGEREEISEADVLFVLKRTKQDPIYDFTNAVTDRNLDDALFYLGSLLSGGFHPLQVLSALVNQVRRLVIVKAFTEKLPDGLWRADAPYLYFQKSILPLALAQDQQFLDKVAKWEGDEEEGIPSKNKTRGAKKPGKPKKTSNSDLLIAPNPNSPYPVYKSMQKSDRFAGKELFIILEALSKADSLLKSTDHSPRSILENVVITICGATESS